jgi:exodeoxyribonuclease VII small subunit
MYLGLPPTDSLMTEKNNSSLDFEAALDELEKLVARMEDGDLPLEETLKQFERGIELARRCQKALSDAEQKVDVLVEKSGRTDIEPFETEK